MARKIQIEENLIDRAVKFFSPVAGMRRMHARTQMAIAGQWLGGRRDRRSTKDWNPATGSADADLLFDLPTMRDRSRDALRNNPLALGAVNTVVTNVVGTGLALRSRIDADVIGLTPEEKQTLQRQFQNEFNCWANNASSCDIERTLDFSAMQSLALRSCLEAGDVFAVLPMVQRKGSHYLTKVQLVEADRVCNKDRKADTETLAGGIEKDASGAPVRVHILKQHPGSLAPTRTNEWDVVEMFGAKTGRRNVVHLFDKRRIGQSRGAPYLAPVIEPLKQLSDYTQAEITAAVVSGLFTVFVETENGLGLDAGPQSTGNAPGADMKMGAGAIVDLAAGEKISFANPGRPNAAFDPFVQAVLRQIGVALEIPFEILIKHFTASYSAARAAMLEAWRFFRNRRAWLSSMFCQPIYEAVLEEAIAAGRLYAPGFFEDPAIRAAYCGAEWMGDSPGQLDPVKEVSAATARIQGGLSNHTIETMQLMGLDWNDVHQTLATELAERKAKGTILDLQPEAFGDLNKSQTPDNSDQQDQPNKDDQPDTETE